MEYLFLIYSDPQRFADRTPEQRGASMAEHFSIQDDSKARGVFRSAAPLEPIAKTITVRSTGTHSMVTDGPFVETKECLGGYYLLECASPDDARYWAERISHAVGGAAVEIRGAAAIPARVANA